MLFRSRFDPLNALTRLQTELESVFRNPSAFDLGLTGRGAHPPVNVFRDDDGLVVRVEVPGFAPEELDIRSTDRTLTLSGKRAETSEVGSAHRRERWVGEFSRAIQIPAAYDLERCEAQCKHGVLTVRVPMAETAKPRQIAVQA